uniref:Putative protease n=1 Tax=viral metagenome TaxID=1070528 RepID=A0A6H1ZBR3_9ZZZZ
MKLSYRSIKNAEATARYWNKSLDKPDWYEIEALSDDEAEILIYDVIGWPFNDAAELVRALAEMKQKTITVRINSPGGDVFDSMAIFNVLQSHKSKIVTRIESLVASSASFIALAGKEVQAYKNAMMMIHDPWVFAIGNQYELRETADILEKVSGNMVDIYVSESNVGKKEVKAMLKAETWMTAKEAKEKGFIDTIVDGKAIKAQFDLSMFANAPDDILSVQDSGRELTRKETERALRNAGASRDYARAMAAKGAGASDIDVEMIEDLLKLKMLIGGK